MKMTQFTEGQEVEVRIDHSWPRPTWHRATIVCQHDNKTDYTVEFDGDGLWAIFDVRNIRLATLQTKGE